MSNYNLNIKKFLKFKGLNVIIIVLVSLFFFRNSIHAQDTHFSQLLSTPVITNPANTGFSDEPIRFATDYRNQWASIGVPFNTFYSSFDTKLNIKNQLFGLGLAIIHDQSSILGLSAEKAYLSISYTRFFKTHQFVIGIQPGIVYKYYNLNEITLGSQFDHSISRFDPNLPSREYNLNDNMRYIDFNIGLLWRAHIKTLIPIAGISLAHLNRPVESFIMDNSGARLPVKLTLHGQLIIPINSKYDISPCFLFSYTPGARELLTGAIGGYYPGNFFIPVKKIYAMNLYRINPVRNIDAIILGGGIKFSKIDIGISYDINISSLSNATNYNGAFEIAIIFTGGGQRLRSGVEPCVIY
jgi:type IX secretion system PorP/SprF family membrane protein